MIDLFICLLYFNGMKIIEIYCYIIDVDYLYICIFYVRIQNFFLVGEGGKNNYLYFIVMYCLLEFIIIYIYYMYCINVGLKY